MLRIGGEAFETVERFNPWLIMKLSKAQQSRDEQAAMAALFDLLINSVQAHERPRLDEHLTATVFTIDDLESAVEQALPEQMRDEGIEPDPSGQRSASGSNTPGSADRSSSGGSSSPEPRRRVRAPQDHLAEGGRSRTRTRPSASAG